MNKFQDEKLLTRKQTAEFLGVTEGTLAVWACTKRYELAYIKIGRLVKYRQSDILIFLEKRRHNDNIHSNGDK